MDQNVNSVVHEVDGAIIALLNAIAKMMVNAIISMANVYVYQVKKAADVNDHVVKIDTESIAFQDVNVSQR